ncbi:unnamed protein product, partial [Heterosigma akashiwo]
VPHGLCPAAVPGARRRGPAVQPVQHRPHAERPPRRGGAVRRGQRLPGGAEGVPLPAGVAGPPGGDRGPSASPGRPGAAHAKQPLGERLGGGGGLGRASGLQRLTFGSVAGGGILPSFSIGPANEHCLFNCDSSSSCPLS